MVNKKFSGKLVKLKLTIKRKIELHHRSNIVSPARCKTAKTPLNAYSKILLRMNAEADLQLGYTYKIVYFIKLDNGLILTVYAKIFIRCLTGFLKHPIVILPTLILHHIIYTKYLA